MHHYGSIRSIELKIIAKIGYIILQMIATWAVWKIPKKLCSLVESFDSLKKLLNN